MKTCAVNFVCCMLLVVAMMAAGDCAAQGREAAGEGAPGSVTQTNDPHRHLEQIMERPLFQRWRLRQEGQDFEGSKPLDFGQSEWVKKAGETIRDFFRWLFESKPKKSKPTSSGGGGMALPVILKLVAWIVLGVALAFLVVLVIKSLGRPTMQGASARVLSRRQIRGAMEAGDALALDAAGWIDEANRLAAERDFRAVYRALYLALLSGLDKAGKIEHDRNRTNWTYVKRYRGPAEERQVFGELTNLFDRVWYGRKPAEDDLDELRRKVERLTLQGGTP